MEVPEDLSVLLDTYDLRRKFIEGLNGSTMGEVILYSSQFPLLTFVVVSFELLVLNKFQISSLKTKASSKYFLHAYVYILEFVMIVMPVTSMFTFLSDYIYSFFLLMIALTTVIVISSVSNVNDNVQYWKVTSLKQVIQYEGLNCKKQLYITFFRSFVLLVTAVSILGVDFHIFPRRFAKTESYGVSLMDLGVGLFVVSNALVEKQTSGLLALKKTSVSSLVLLTLGTLRCLLIQNLDYQTHITEYGRHWNFFFTLAFTKVFSSLMMIILRGHSFVTGIVLVALHQYILSNSLETFILNFNQREDWFSANIEGISSLCGYLSLHLIGITVATFLNQTKNKLKVIAAFSFISLFFFCVLHYYGTAEFEISRRLANLPYVLWITAISLELIVLFMLTEFLLYWLLPIEPQNRNKLYNLLTPVVFESINFNGLFFFLISNVMTGCINMFLDAFSSGVLLSSLILLSYMFVDCALIFILYLLNVRLQF